MMKSLRPAALALTLLPAGAAQAADPVQQHNSNAVWFENWVGLSNGSMRVATPEGEITTIQAETGTPVYELRAPATDGVYRYELRAVTEDMVKNRDQSPAMEGEERPEYVPAPFYRTGFFVVDRGVIITPELEEEEEG